MTTTQELPITKYLELYEDKINIKNWNWAWYMLQVMAEIIPMVRTFELSLIEKAKKEERERIVGILFEWMWTDWTILQYKNLTIKEAIERITNQI